MMDDLFPKWFASGLEKIKEIIIIKSSLILTVLPYWIHSPERFELYQVTIKLLIRKLKLRNSSTLTKNCGIDHNRNEAACRSGIYVCAY